MPVVPDALELLADRGRFLLIDHRLQVRHHLVELGAELFLDDAERRIDLRGLVAEPDEFVEAFLERFETVAEGGSGRAATLRASER